MKTLIKTVFFSAIIALGVLNPLTAELFTPNAYSTTAEFTTWVEWFCDSDGQWWKIIYDATGPVKIIPVSGPGVD